jgi:iron complex transport system substrate-binding protein
LSTRFFLLHIAFTLSLVNMAVPAEVSVIDDADTKITLTANAGRIISLAPNLTELLYSAGAGNRIVATVSYSDYPESAREIPRIGDAHNVDIESIIALQPDLVVLWQSGNNPAVHQKLINTGLKVYQSEPDTVEGIGTTIQRFGVLAGTEAVANRVSREFHEDIESIRKRYAGKVRIRVFYQFWDRPIYTINGRHLISRIIELCGGENVYAGLSALTPQISTEAVLDANPEIIIASGRDEQRPDWLDGWLNWPEITAVRTGQLYFIPPELIQRHTIRITHGARMMCEVIDRARTSP